MTGLLDHFFNNYFIVFLFCILFAFAFYFSCRQFLTKPSGEVSLFLQVVSIMIGVIGPILLGATNQLVCGYGFSDTLMPVGLRGDVMLFQSVFETDDSSTYKLHGVNLETGKKLFRRSFRNLNLVGKLEAWNGDLVWINPSKGMVHPRSDEIIALSSTTGKTVFELERNTLRKKSGLKAEISKIGSFTGDNTIIIQTKDGRWTEVDPVKLTVLREQDYPVTSTNPPSDFKIKKIDCTSTALVMDTVWRLEGDTRMQLQFDEPGDDRVAGAPGMVFIKGCLIPAFLDRNRILIMSWEDTDKKHFLFHSFSVEGKLIWRLQGRDMEEHGIQNAWLSLLTRHRGNLILLMGGYVVSINIDNGNINWMLRL